MDSRSGASGPAVASQLLQRAMEVYLCAPYRVRAATPVTQKSCCHMQASSYLNKLPQKLAADDRVLIVDPMLATGKPPLAWPGMYLSHTKQ